MKSSVLKRKVVIVSVVLTMLLSSVLVLGSCGCSGSDKKVSYSWPTTGLAALLPQPEFKYGKITTESANEFQAVFYYIEQKDFDSYVDSCKGKGFAVDYEKKDTSYKAKDASGNQLSIDYLNYSKEPELVVKVTTAQKIAEDEAKKEQAKAEQEAKKQAEEAAKAEQANQQQSSNAQGDANNAMQQANDALQNYNDTVRQSKELVDSYSNLLDQVSKFQ